MVQTGHAAAAVMAVVAAASDGERLPPLPLVMGFWEGKRRSSRSHFAPLQNAGGNLAAGRFFFFTFISLRFPISLLLQIIFPKMLSSTKKINPATGGTQTPGALNE
jgi:hypothetical protein